MYTQIIIEKIIELCDERGVSAHQMLRDANLNKSLVDNLKKGSMPAVDKICFVADYFGVSVDYILGRSNSKTEKPAENGELTEHEQNLINAYRLQPHLQEAVDRVLGIKDLKILGTERDGKVILFKAAASQNHHDTEIIEMDSEQWKKIKESPNTDDSLL